MKKIVYTVLMLMAVAALSSCDKRPGADASGPEQAVSSASSESTAAEQASAASRYDGKIVRRAPIDGGKEDGWFYVKDGKRRWIVNASWLATQGLKPEDVLEISADELHSIPEDPEALGVPKQ